MYRYRPQSARLDNRVQQRLFKAVRAGDIDTVKELLEEYDDNAILSMALPRQPVLYAAVESCQTDMLKFLLSLDGASAHLQVSLWNKDSLLHVATRAGKEEHMIPIVRMLLDQGLDPDRPGWNNLLAMDCAVFENKPEIVRALITHGNDTQRIAVMADRCLKMARKEGIESMVSSMSDLMESFDKSDPEFALYIAIINKDLQRIHDLFFRHVDPFGVRFGEKKMSALHVAARQRDIRVLTMLLAEVVTIGRVDAEDVDGQTPLHYAATQNNARNVNWLLFIGADPKKEDKMHTLPAQMASSVAVINMLSDETSYCDKIPDAVILMRGNWSRELPFTFCTLSKSVFQASATTFPPVLLLRCVKEDISNKRNLETSTFEVDETRLEVYEYRCSQPSVICIEVDVTRYGHRDDDAGTKFFFLCTNDVGKVVNTVALVISTQQEGRCDVNLLKSGKLVLVCRKKYQVVRAPVGQGHSLITDDHLQGFELEVSSDTFSQKQHIMIKASKPPQLLKAKWPPKALNVEESDQSNTSLDDQVPEFAPIKNISCFYSIKNTAEEKPLKSLNMKIPLETTTVNRVVTLVRSHRLPENVSRSDDGNNDEDDDDRKQVGYDDDFETESGEEEDNDETENTQQTKQKPGLDNAMKRSREVRTNDGRGGSEAKGDSLKKGTLLPTRPPANATRVTVIKPAWKMAEQVSVNQQNTYVSVALRNTGIVVAAEVDPNMSEADIIHAIETMYSRKKQILIFAMVKPYPGKHVEVMVCCVSEERFDDTVKDRQQDGYATMKRPPIVAYAFNGEVFSLRLMGNLIEMFMETEPILEYQVGGRLNYTSFVLEPKEKKKPATGVIEIKRHTTQNSMFSSVGLVHLDLSSFFLRPSSKKQQKPPKSKDESAAVDSLFPSGATGSNMDKLVVKLSETMSTDIVRMICHALGLTRETLNTVCDREGNSYLSPAKKNFRMLSKARSQFRSEPAFRKHLKDVLERNNENGALQLMDTILTENAPDVV